jgi:hypothetical protein
MRISDLDHLTTCDDSESGRSFLTSSNLENLSKSQKLLGGSSISMGAWALAAGSDAYALAETKTNLKVNRKLTLARGTATALAIGDITDIGTFYALDGFDLQKVKTKTFSKKNLSFERTKVLAIDLPG